MKNPRGLALGGFCSILLLAAIAIAKPVQLPPQQFTTDAVQPDIVGPVDGMAQAAPSKVLADTVWIADWSFDGPGG